MGIDDTSLVLKFFCVGVLVALGVISCSSSSKTVNYDMGPLDTLVTGENFEIRSDWAMPLTTNSMNSLAAAGLFPPGSSAGQINLIGNTNFVKVKGDSLFVNLPYYGERQMGGGYSSSGSGIVFEGIPMEIEIVRNAEKGQYNIQCNIERESENFTLRILFFSNFSSDISINSTQRFPIRFTGTVAAVPTDN